ncbi:MAG: hypothetical protein ACFFDP_04605 [Promethearchaeota archaeon]
MGQTETIETLGILGGIGSVLSPFITISLFVWVYWFFFYIFSIPVFLALIGGIISCALSISGIGKVRTMPQRSRRDFQAAGLIELVIGFVCFNWLMLLSAILILVAYAENDELWKKISLAREQTGFPFVSVATAAGSIWNRRLSCQFCGAPLVIITAVSRGPWVQVKGLCPLDSTTDVVRLPLALLEEWVPVLADRFHRCEQCGERTAAQIVVRQTYQTTTLRAYCPLHHANKTYRYIWTPLYPHAARSPSTDVGFRSRRYYPRVYPLESPSPIHPQPFIQYPQVTYTPSTSQSVAAPRPQTMPSQFTTPTQNDMELLYCRECGVRLEPTDRFCFRCGQRIR